MAYTQEKLDLYRENTYGIGYGRTLYDKDHNSDELYGMVFADSHSKPEYIAGFAHRWISGVPTNLHTGAGYTMFFNYTNRSSALHADSNDFTNYLCGL